jgi:hypothetical protein
LSLQITNPSSKFFLRCLLPSSRCPHHAFIRHGALIPHHAYLPPCLSTAVLFSADYTCAAGGGICTPTAAKQRKVQYEYREHSYCTHTALILHSYCTHTLYSYCTHTMYSYCTHTVLISILILCTHTVLIHCTHTLYPCTVLKLPEIAQLLETRALPPGRVWQANSSTPHFYYADENGTRHRVDYDDSQSLRAK